jgi:IclR family KDG regulon transcriptional repressor
MKAAAENYMIKTVARAMDLLDQFREDEAEFGITDLSNRLKLEKNSVFRLVVTLASKKYIELNNSTGKYRLGRQARALGQLAAAQIDYVNHARPVLNELKQQCHETCFFSVNKDGYTYYLDGVESDLPVRVVQLAGKSRPLCCTAAGRVLLAFMEPQKLMNLLANSDTKGFTASTITDIDLLQNDLNKVAWQGYAIDDQEHEAGVVEVAAPVFDGNGAVIGALSILGPKMRITDRLETELLPLLCKSAAHLSGLLGFSRAREVLTEANQQTAKPERMARKLELNPYVYGGLKPCC